MARSAPIDAALLMSGQACGAKSPASVSLSPGAVVRPPRLLIVTGEASGDLQGACLVQSLWKVHRALDIAAVGGERMRAAGVRIVEDSSLWGFIGFWDAIIRLPQLYGIYRRLCRAVLQECPDILVLIDCPGFNMRLATYARSLGIPTVYYFPPSAWTRNEERVRHIAARVDHVVAAFSYTDRIFRKAGCPISYFGHPLVDVVRPRASLEEVRERLGIRANCRVIGLLPGSRRAEIMRMGPVLLEAARILTRELPDLHFLLPVASPALAGLVEHTVARHAAGLSLTVVEGGASDVMSCSELLVMTSGSASLEAVIHETPMILVYRLARPDWWLAHLVLSDFTYMGLPNLILGDRVVPELLQDDANPVRVAQEALGLLTDATRYRKMKDNLLEVKKQLGEPGVVDRVAQYIWETISNGPGRGHHNE